VLPEAEDGQGTQAKAGRGAAQINVVVLGLPGAGKGTQAAIFTKARRIPKISTGDMLRAAIARDTPLGRQVGVTLDQGGLVDDETMIAVVRERLSQPDTARGFLLDGFPRTVPQAEVLQTLLADRDPLVVVYLEMAPEVIIDRILQRKICEACGQPDTGSPPADYCASCGGDLVTRADDQIDVVRQRIAAYLEHTQPLVDWYRSRGVLRSVNGDQPFTAVARDFATAVTEGVSRVPLS
jgi:adenylate kinase